MGKSILQFSRSYLGMGMQERRITIDQALTTRHLNEMVTRLGSENLARNILTSWFVSHDGIAKAYDFFVQKIGRWTWKPLIWKQRLLPT